MTDLMERWTVAMRSGAYEQAWALSDAALRARDPATRDDPALPYHQRWVWDGRPFDGRDVLVRCYHGLGDTIMFARYLPLLAARARSVTVEAPAPLHPLLARIRRAGRLVAFDPAHPLPPSECDIEITELDFALRIPPTWATAPYLALPPAILPRGTVGLCYQAGDWDAERSIPPALFEPLCAQAQCLTLVAEPTTLAVLNPRGCPLDMEATAALVAATELVVTVDTMIAHLAGALGKPVWLLLKAAPDWRWTPWSPVTPWYPSMRLYFQPSPGDWASVLEQVGHDLAARRAILA